jgi:arginine:ornithine antiporter/lysine permease
MADQVFLIISLLPQRLSVLLFHRLGGNPAADVFSGAYALKLALSGRAMSALRKRNKDIVVGLVATVYGLWLYTLRVSNSY